MDDFDITKFGNILRKGNLVLFFKELERYVKDYEYTMHYLRNLLEANSISPQGESPSHASVESSSSSQRSSEPSPSGSRRRGSVSHGSGRSQSGSHRKKRAAAGAASTLSQSPPATSPPRGR